MLLDQAEAGTATWTIVETCFDPASQNSRESVFTVGNGYLGTRGSFEERYPGDQPATLVGGLFDGAPLVRRELAAVPDWLATDLVIDGERFALEQGQLLTYRRALDLRDGILTRRVRWRCPRGQTLELHSERWASLADERLCVLRLRITALDLPCDVQVRAVIDGTVENPGILPPCEVGLRHWRVLGQGNPTPQSAYLHTRTRVSGVELAVAMHLDVEGATSADLRPIESAQAPGVAARFCLGSGETAVVTKLVRLAMSPPEERPVIAALQGLQAALDRGYLALLRTHRATWADLWRDCDILIEGDDEAQRAVRFNLYHLLIAAPRCSDGASIPARALSGFGYHGHVFWDADIYMAPFFTFTRPELARNLLLYRYRTLAGAHENARQLGHEGAKYAWESADGGHEVTPPWLPGPDGRLVPIAFGALEQHIVADVAYAVWQYWQVTGDDAFMRDYGAEILLDTAAFWGSRAEHNGTAGRYELHDVVGPDEYHEHVDNNAYTNALARWHLARAAETLAWLRARYPAQAAALERRLALSDEKLTRWQEIRGHMYVPYDPATGLFEQFDGFFQLRDLDLRTLEPRCESVQRVLGIEQSQRVQICKQPDVLMLLYLLGNEYDERVKRVNWQYYAPRTDCSFGSSLGPAVLAALAAELGYAEDAYHYFMQAARMDLDDARRDTQEGIHVAAAGGVWQAVVRGFAGLRLGPEGPRCVPRLPGHWRRLRFRIRYRGQPLEVDLRAGEEPIPSGGTHRLGGTTCKMA